MSSCISSHGEYSEHEITTTLFTCDRCGVFDEAAAMAEIDRLNATIQRVREMHPRADDPYTYDSRDVCDRCETYWPCSTIRALEAALGGEQ